ncbi:MAG: DUF6323 family protein [Candidatus Saccharibacteria bacterium]
MSGILKFTSSMNSLMRRSALTQILGTNDRSQKHQLKLSEADAVEIIEARDMALKNLGRFELNFNIIHEIITTFCSSPYINQLDYAATICDLVEIFYYMKNETGDQIGDNEIIGFMRHHFDNQCFGSIELLVGRELESLLEELRQGRYYGSLIDDDEE